MPMLGVAVRKCFQLTTDKVVLNSFFSSNPFNSYLSIIAEVKSPAKICTVWMIPVVFFTTPVAKEGIKASVCGKVLRLEETQMPLKDENRAYTMLNHAVIKPNNYSWSHLLQIKCKPHWTLR